MEARDAEAEAFFRSLPSNMVRETMRLLQRKGSVRRLDADTWEVDRPDKPNRPARVMREGDLVRCSVDKNNQDQPCRHILAVMIEEGMVDRPDSSASVYKKTRRDRNHALEAEAWRLVPVKVPEYLARPLDEALPVLAPEAPPGRGRPRVPLSALVYQSVMRAAERRNLRATRGAMDTPTHRDHNPHGGIPRSTISDFLARPATGVILEKLLAVSTWPARSFETLVHPDGTGLTEQRFGAYYDERYDGRKKERKEAEEEARAIAKERGETYQAPEARKHHWTYAEILWTYRYTMIAALHTQQGPFAEAPWLVPLLERARLMLEIKELGGDKAYVAYYIFDYAGRHGIEPQIKLKRNTNPTQSNAKKKVFKRTYERSLIDGRGYAARANRRNNAETGNHAFKMVLGDQIYSKDAVAQRHEVLCMAIAYNLIRLIYLALDQGIEPGFREGAEALAGKKWVHLSTLHRRFRGRSTPA